MAIEMAKFETNSDTLGFLGFTEQDLEDDISVVPEFGESEDETECWCWWN